MAGPLLKMTAMREGAARQYPLGGIQSAEQVADVMAFLLGDDAETACRVASVQAALSSLRCRLVD